jgi:hypothetical protein
MEAMEKELHYSTRAAEQSDVKIKELQDQLRECNDKVCGDNCM